MHSQRKIEQSNKVCLLTACSLGWTNLAHSATPLVSYSQLLVYLFSPLLIVSIIQRLCFTDESKIGHVISDAVSPVVNGGARGNCFPPVWWPAPANSAWFVASLLHLPRASVLQEPLILFYSASSYSLSAQQVLLNVIESQNDLGWKEPYRSSS